MSMDFVVRPQSKIDPEEVRARAKAMVQDQRRMKVCPSFQVNLYLYYVLHFTFVHLGTRDN